MTDIYKEADNLFNGGKFREALKKLEESTASPTEDLDLWTLKARCYEKLNRHEDAFHAAQAVFKVGTNNIRIIQTLGEGYFRNGDYDSASKMFLLAHDAVESKEDRAHFKSRIKVAKKQEKKQNKKKASGARALASTAEVPEASTDKASPEKASSLEVKIKNRAEELGESAKEESIEVAKKDARTLPFKFSVILSFTFLSICMAMFMKETSIMRLEKFQKLSFQC